MEWKNTGLYFILKLLYDKDIKYIYIYKSSYQVCLNDIHAPGGANNTYQCKTLQYLLLLFHKRFIYF